MEDKSYQHPAARISEKLVEYTWSIWMRIVTPREEVIERLGEYSLRYIISNWESLGGLNNLTDNVED